MIRIALDSDVLGDLPVGIAPLLLTYADLIPNQAVLNALKAKHPSSELIFIDRGLGDPLDLGTVADIEPGALTVDDLHGWVKRKNRAGKTYLTGYCDRNDLAAVEAADRHGLWHWVATLDGTCHIAGFPPLQGPAAVQILGTAKVGLHCDMSLVLEDNWHPQTAGATAGLEAMATMTTDTRIAETLSESAPAQADDDLET